MQVSDIEWRARFEQLGIRDHVDRLCRPFVGQPSMDQWLALLEAVAALHQRDGIALVVIDSLTNFLPAHSENSAAALLECSGPLQRLAGAGISVLLVRRAHDCPGRILAMFRRSTGRAEPSRRRLLNAWLLAKI
jgi:hypothetical protein